jgi:photosystem II stability/assembly factor-like uncharacterized protein
MVILPSGEVFAGTVGLGMVRSTDHGTSWIQVNTGIDDPYINALASTHEGTLFAAPGHTGLYRSTDKGASWSRSENGLPPGGVTYAYAVTSFAGIVLVGTSNVSHGLYRSSDNGSSWVPSDSGLPSFAAAFGIHPSGMIFATAFYDGVYKSFDSGRTWSPANTLDKFTDCFQFASDGAIFAGNFGEGVARSLDTGATWTFGSTGLTNKIAQCMILPRGKYEVLVGTEDGGIFRSTNNGDTWNNYSDGLSILDVQAIVKDSAGYLYSATFGGGICRTVDPVTAVGPEKEKRPSTYQLFQNYPNPFNPQTKISYAVARRSHVHLAIYDMLGLKVMSLVDQVQDAQFREVTVDASNLATGVYFYRLEAIPLDGAQSERFIATKKLLVIK